MRTLRLSRLLMNLASPKNTWSLGKGWIEGYFKNVTPDVAGDVAWGNDYNVPKSPFRTSGDGWNLWLPSQEADSSEGRFYLTCVRLKQSTLIVGVDVCSKSVSVGSWPLTPANREWWWERETSIRDFRSGAYIRMFSFYSTRGPLTLLLTGGFWGKWPPKSYECFWCSQVAFDLCSCRIYCTEWLVSKAYMAA